MIDLEKLERLAKAATPGPWHSQGFDIYGWEKKRRVFVARTAPVVVGNSNKIIRYLNNADYVTAACNAVPELIAENAALKTENADLRNQLRDALAKEELKE